MSAGEYVEANRESYRSYRASLSAIDGVSVLAFDEMESNNFQYVVAEVDDSRAGLTRDEIVEVLRSEGVLARRYFAPGTYQTEPFAEASKGRELPNTDRLAETVMCLPTGTQVRAGGIETIADIVRLAVNNASVVRETFARSACNS